MSGRVGSWVRGVRSDMEGLRIDPAAAARGGKLIDFDDERAGQTRWKIGGLLRGGVELFADRDGGEGAFDCGAVQDFEIVGFDRFAHRRGDAVPGERRGTSVAAPPGETQIAVRRPDGGDMRRRERDLPD